MTKPIVYTQNQCKYCQIVKNYLEDRGVEYETRNINDKEEYRQEHEALGFQSVPVTVIGDHKIVGFDLRKLNQALAE